MCITIADNFRNEGKRLVQCLHEGEISVEQLDNLKAHIPSVQRECDTTRTSTPQLEEVAVGFFEERKVIHTFGEEGPKRVLFACGLHLQGPLALIADLEDHYGDRIFQWQNSIGWKLFRPEYHLCVVFDLTAKYKFGTTEFFMFLEKNNTTLPAPRGTITKSHYLPIIIISQHLPIDSKVGNDPMWAHRLLKISTTYLFTSDDSQTLLVPPEPYPAPYLSKQQSQ
eukprot:GHVT01103902.1.p1 GENE.GHVT01103902.1~~GHVT01103902.1.p1  ORF type:complete len:225 (+),score=8.81 GHVT01103902.1:82-756(+)